MNILYKWFTSKKLEKDHVPQDIVDPQEIIESQKIIDSLKPKTKEFEELLEKANSGDSYSEFIAGRVYSLISNEQDKGTEFILNSAEHGNEKAERYIRDHAGLLHARQERNKARGYQEPEPPRQHYDYTGSSSGGCATAALVVFIYIPIALFVIGGIIGLLWFGIKQLL